MKNKILLIICIAFFALSGYSQDLSFYELTLLQGKDLDYVNNYLTKKKWEFNSSDVDNSESFKNYTTVGWSLNKNSWNNKAEAWFYFYQQFGAENMVGYQTSKLNFNKLKTAAQINGYKLLSTDAIKGGLKTKYRNNKLEIIFTASNKNDDEYSYENTVYYFIMVYNYKEIEEQIKLQEELERQELEAQLKRELEEKIKEEKYQTLISQADSLFQKKNFSASKSTYSKALVIKPEENYPSNKITEIEKLLFFLEERKTKIYDYKELNYSDFNSINNSIISKIQNTLKEKNISGFADYKITYKIDTLGTTSFSLIETGVPNPEISNLIKPLIKDILLKQVSKNGYSVFAKSEHVVNIKMEEKIFEVKKNNVETIVFNNPNSLYKTEINQLVSSGPIGRYTIRIQKKEINNVDFSNNSVSKYRSIGGPSNMFLSVLVPGLGVKGVTGGSKSGLSRTLWTYGFILSGVGCKFMSISEYDKYHSATDQTLMDEYYENANLLNKSFYVLTATGAVIWLYDIIWVANKGFQNKKEQRRYKQNISLYYEPNNQMLGLNYKLKF